MTYKLSVTTVSAYAHEPEPGCAVDAARERYNRLRTAGIKAEHLHGLTSAEITYTEPISGDLITLTYTDTENQT